MIAHLRGTILASELESLVLDVQGVGYEVHVPLGTQGRLNPSPDGQVSLWIHTSVREDAIQLYGFATADDRRLFQRLINVNGVGPRIGLATLSELSPGEVVTAVQREEINTFTRVSGIGKKTAQRLILELKSALDDLMILPTAPAGAPSGFQNDLRSALTNLGFQSSQIDSVILKLEKEDLGEEPIEALLRRSLKMLN